MALTANVTARSDVGRRRERNEDFAVLGEWCPDEVAELASTTTVEVPLAEPTVVAAIDGLGGHAGGDLASNYLGGQLHAIRRRATDPESVTAVLREMNQAMVELTRRPDFEWMVGAGATIAGLALGPGDATWFNVGDARAYEVVGGYLSQLSVDDSPAGAEGGSTTSVVLQTLGGTPDLRPIEPHTGVVELRAGDRFLLTTDGLTDLVPHADIEAALAGPAAAAVDELVQRALDAGGRDNITVVVVDIATAGGW